MKRLNIYLLFLPLFFSGCIKEYLDKCPLVTDNVRLEFVYTGDGTNDILYKVVNSINVYVYDAQGRKVVDKRVEREMLERERGVALSLEAGVYRVVCWGNVAENTEISGEESYSTAAVHHPLYVSGGRIPANDPLYYAECETLPVPSEGGEVTRTVSFRSAHIDMDIYVSGGKVGPEFVPLIEVSNLYPEYDFAMNPTPVSRNAGCNTATYYPSCAYDADKQAATVGFSVLRFASDDPVEITLRDKDAQEPMYVLALKDFLSSNGIRVEQMQECRIPIHISFNQDLSVEVTIPEWEAPDVKPEL